MFDLRLADKYPFTWIIKSGWTWSIEFPLALGPTYFMSTANEDGLNDLTLYQNQIKIADLPIST